MQNERITVFSQDQGLGKLAMCALILPDKSLLFVTWAVKATCFSFYWCSQLYILYGQDLAFQDGSDFCFAFDFVMHWVRWLWRLILEKLSTASMKVGAAGPWDLGPDPCCLTWFITTISVKYPNHQQSFLYTQGEGWASLSVWQVRGKICHYATRVNSSGTMLGGLHLSCFT